MELLYQLMKQIENIQYFKLDLSFVDMGGNVDNLKCFGYGVK